MDATEYEHGPAPVKPAAAPLLLVAGEDLLIDRPDLGPGASTLVVKGQQVPGHLVVGALMMWSRATGQPAVLARQATFPDGPSVGVVRTLADGEQPTVETVTETRPAR